MPQRTNSSCSFARYRDTKEMKNSKVSRWTGEQESLPQQAEVTIGLLPACFPGKGTQWHKCQTTLNTKRRENRASSRT